MTIKPSSANATGSSALTKDVRDRLDRVWRKAYGIQSNSDLVDFYSMWADDYDRDHEAIGFFGHESAARILMDQLDDPKTAHILDAGAGTGAAGVKLKEFGAERITAIDLSPEMLQLARHKNAYQRLFAADLGQPLDQLHDSEFDAAILVGVFSYGQAPAHAIDEMIRVVRPGGYLVFTLRNDFDEQNAMGVRGLIEDRVKEGALRLRTVSQPAQYLPNKDPDVLFRVWCYEVLPGKDDEPSPEFVEAVRTALSSSSPVKVIDHSHIWDAAGSRLYDAYIERGEYYLTQCEEELLEMHASRIVGQSDCFVELGCGSARKVSHLLSAALQFHDQVEYIPIDVSAGAIEGTTHDVSERFGERVTIMPELGMFTETLGRIPSGRPKTVLFFGGSIGNIRTQGETVEFLRQLRSVLRPDDRLIVGFDLQKNPDVILSAYNAGEENYSFFLHMVRRMNRLLRANFDLGSFQLASTYDAEPEYCETKTWCANLKVATRVAQNVTIGRLNETFSLRAGDAIQVGVSRKFRTDDIRILAWLSGMRLCTMWFDRKQYFTLAELVRLPDQS